MGERWLFARNRPQKRVKLHDTLRNLLNANSDFKNFLDTAFACYDHSGLCFFSVPLPRHLADRYGIEEITFADFFEEIIITI
jgi:hypothetical protein